MLGVRKALGILISVLALVGVLITVALATHRIDQRPRTDDAYLQADLVHMAPAEPIRLERADGSNSPVEIAIRDALQSA
jgi:hypothetical protein